jgi:hypothetical protein
MKATMATSDSAVQQVSSVADAAKLLSEQIKAIDDAMKRIEAGPLKKRAIMLLIKDISRVSYQDIESVLNAMGRLKAEFVKS